MEKCRVFLLSQLAVKKLRKRLTSIFLLFIIDLCRRCGHMLKRFSVTNFMNFKEKLTWDLGSPANYEFNSDIVEKGCITKGLIYGINGSGKSNLALALFDIILHLTDKEKIYDKYNLYLNLESKKNIAEFEYVFEFEGIEVVYKYSKYNPYSLAYEKVLINGDEVLCFDFDKQKGNVCLDGTENLQLDSPSLSEAKGLSRVKYVKSNAMLKDVEKNRAFMSFTNFVDNMLMFYSLQETRYQGFTVGIERCTQGIIREKKTKDFEKFLRKHGIEYKLVEQIMNDGSKELYCQFDNGNVPLTLVASQGTLSCTLFYYWYIQMSKASFVYADEFDSFYHFELSEEMIRMIKNIPHTQIFLSTHNTDLFSNELLRPDAYFLIQDGKIKSIDKLTDKELRKAHNIQKMYKAGAFNE